MSRRSSISRRAALGLTLPAALAVVASANGCKKKYVPSTTWYGTVEGALEMGRMSKQPILFFFWASWDCAGRELETVTFPDPLVRDLLQDFVCARIDCSEDEVPWVSHAKERFKIVGIPTLVFVTPDGEELLRFNEFVQPRRFAETLKSILADARSRGLVGYQHYL